MYAKNLLNLWILCFTSLSERIKKSQNCQSPPKLASLKVPSAGHKPFRSRNRRDRCSSRLSPFSVAGRIRVIVQSSAFPALYTTEPSDLTQRCKFGATQISLGDNRKHYIRTCTYILYTFTKTTISRFGIINALKYCYFI